MNGGVIIAVYSYPELSFEIVLLRRVAIARSAQLSDFTLTLWTTVVLYSSTGLTYALWTSSMWMIESASNDLNMLCTIIFPLFAIHNVP